MTADFEMTEYNYYIHEKELGKYYLIGMGEKVIKKVSTFQEALKLTTAWRRKDDNLLNIYFLRDYYIDCIILGDSNELM
jgi:hypothetical protein